MTTNAEHRLLLRRAARRPHVIGALTPTSSKVAATLSRVVPSSGAPTVVEIGPGTGALCPAIGERLCPAARYVAVELDPALVAYLRAALPWLEVIAGDAAELAGLLERAEVGPVDVVVASLPWTLLPAQHQRRIVEQIATVLRPTGVFTTISYLTGWPARVGDFRRLLESTFDEVLVTNTMWYNLPPARALVCRRPMGAG